MNTWNVSFKSAVGIEGFSGEYVMGSVDTE
jgi:hypothetical protein